MRQTRKMGLYGEETVWRTVVTHEHEIKNNMAESLEDYSYWCDVLRRNDSIPVSQRNWTDITEALTGLKICTRDETCR